MKRCRFENVGVGVFTQLLGLERLLHRRQHVHRPQRSEAPDRLGRRHAGRKFSGVEGQVFPPVMASYVAVKLYGPGHVVAYNYIADFHDGIDVETYGNPDGSSPPGRASSTGRSIRRASTGTAGRSRSTSTTTTSPTPRQPDRDRRQHAQHPRDAEHADQLSVAPVLQPAVARRAGLLDPQHRVSPAGRLDAADERRGGRALLQQHDPVGDRRRPARRTCTGATT